MLLRVAIIPSPNGARCAVASASSSRASPAAVGFTAAYSSRFADAGCELLLAALSPVFVPLDVPEKVPLCVARVPNPMTAALGRPVQLVRTPDSGGPRTPSPATTTASTAAFGRL